jgi:NAD(P)-dependent dehydrogenase (short-subunit alcohol dehydrogenase family)
MKWRDTVDCARCISCGCLDDSDDDDGVDDDENEEQGRGVMGFSIDGLMTVESSLSINNDDHHHFYYYHHHHYNHHIHYHHHHHCHHHHHHHHEQQQQSTITIYQVAQAAIYGYTAYAASKWALRGLAESLQMELRWLRCRRY